MTARPLLLIALFASGCAGELAPCDALTAPGDHTCGLDGWSERGYVVHLPRGFDASKSWPIVVVMHGGASDASAMRALTCGPAGCLDALADREGFVTVYAEGTPTAGLDGVRAFNAGGGVKGFRCVSGSACSDGVDDVGFARALLDDLSRVIRVERTRVYFAGFSNGGAMAHRLACELSDRVAAIASIGGANQVAEAQGCAPSRAVPVLHVHGDADPCWPYDGGIGSCFERAGEVYVSVDASMEGWTTRHRCGPSPPTSEMLDDVDPSDGTRVQRLEWQQCQAQVVLMRVSGGGHTWPGGAMGRDEDDVGTISRDIDANAVLWSFLSRHSAP